MNMMRYDTYKPSGIAWIGEVPEHWDVMPLKHGADVIMGQSPSGEDIKDEGVTPFMQGNAEFGSKYPHSSYYCDNCSKHSRVGDILMSVRAPVGELNISDQVYGIGRGLCSIKSEKFDQGFLWFYLQKSKDDFNALANGSTFTAITVDTLNNYPILLPPLAEQEAIAAYLDARCADIDKVVATQEKRIALLQELKQSEITQAVTRGLNPDARMKDSGVEWIGMVPEHWEVTKTLNVLAMPITDGPHETPVLYDEGIPFISAEAVSGGYINFDLMRGYISEEYYKECCKKYIPQYNDIYMIKSGATTGRVAIVETDRIFTIWSPLATFRTNRDRMMPYYLYYLLKSDAYQKQVEYSWTYGTQQNIGMRSLERLKVTIPPLDEQGDIVSYLDCRCGEIDKQIGAVTKQIELLREYKQALITEVVTGKRRV